MLKAAALFNVAPSVSKTTVSATNGFIAMARFTDMTP
jgi:hypothetical protein